MTERYKAEIKVRPGRKILEVKYFRSMITGGGKTIKTQLHSFNYILR